MKRKLLTAALFVLTALLILWGVLRIDTALTIFVHNSNRVCRGEAFATVEEAVRAMEAEARAEYDSSLDFCPPYEVKHTFECGGATILLLSYCEDYDGQVAKHLTVHALRHDSEGRLYFDGAFCLLRLSPWQSSDNHDYFFTSLMTDGGLRTLTLLCLPEGSTQEAYIDGVKAEQAPITIDGKNFTLCHALTAPDSFFRKLSTPVSQRRQVEIR